MSRPTPSGLTVTLIGADGAGKSTVASALQVGSPKAVTYVYLGANPAAATHMLPTTRLSLALKERLGGRKHVSGPPDLDNLRQRPDRRLTRFKGHIKSLVHLGLHAPEEVYRQSVSWIAERRGHLVVQDRHPLLDYYASDVLGLRGWRRVGDRLHGLLIQHVYRGPGRVFLLDAPAEVLHARKPEGTLESLEARRDEYLALRGVIKDLHVISVDRPIDEVVAHVLQLTGETAASVENECVIPAPGAPRAGERAAQLAAAASVQSVLEVLEHASAAGQEVWLDRGWGVDAIVGHATREHHDLDLVTVPGGLVSLDETLRSRGFAGPAGAAKAATLSRLELVSPGGLRVEIRESTEALEAGFGALGHLGGVSVPCVDVGRQLGWRVGRKLTTNDVQAIKLLHGATGTPLPDELRPLGKARVSYRARRLARTIVTLGEPDAATPRWINRLRGR